MQTFGSVIVYIVVTALIAGIIEVLLKKWSGNQLKRGLIAFGGGSPDSSRLWERVYWQYEQKPRFIGTLLESPKAIWCAVTVMILIPFEWWQIYFVPILIPYSGLLTILLWSAWLHALDEHGNIHAQVEYIQMKEKLEMLEDKS